MKISKSHKTICAIMHIHLKNMEHDLSPEALDFIMESDMYSLYLIGFYKMTADDINNYVADYK